MNKFPIVFTYNEWINNIPKNNIIQCEYCRSTGKIDCLECTEGIIYHNCDCDLCECPEEQECENCNGTGKETCEECGGESYLFVDDFGVEKSSARDEYYRIKNKEMMLWQQLYDTVQKNN